MIRLSLMAALLAAALVSPSRAHVLFPPRVQVVRVPPGSVIHRERRGLVWPRWRYVIFATGGNLTPGRPEATQATSNPPPSAAPAQ